MLPPSSSTPTWNQSLQTGLAIPACPLALTASRHLDERRQRALLRYYVAAKAGGLAVGVHTTQFEIRHPKHNLLEPILSLAAEELNRLQTPPSFVRIAGVCGNTDQASQEAALAKRLGFHAALISLSAFVNQPEQAALDHCRILSQILPLFGFYLQPAVGGRPLSFEFWSRFLTIPNVVAIKIAPFNRYQTLDVLRAAAASGRSDIALYTGNDDNIVSDLTTPFRFKTPEGSPVTCHMVGGLLGQWAVWTQRAVELVDLCRHLRQSQQPIPQDLLALGASLTQANAAIFDAANQFHGCIPGIHEVLRQQGLLDGVWCLNEHETLSPGQQNEIHRARQAYPELTDDVFVASHLHEWLQ